MFICGDTGLVEPDVAHNSCGSTSSNQTALSFRGSATIFPCKSFELSNQILSFYYLLQSVPLSFNGDMKNYPVVIIIIIINIYIAQISCEYDQMRVTNNYKTNFIYKAWWSSGLQKINPASGREEDLNPGPPGCKSSAPTTRPRRLLINNGAKIMNE